jgi:hypothetical protein
VVNRAAYDRFSGSCIRLFKMNDPGVVIAYDPATSTRTFPVLARSYCGYQGSGGRLVSFNSLNASANSLLTAIKSLTAGASTTLVAVGAYQNPNGRLVKNVDWIWSDAYTNPAIITNGNWAPGQPEYVGTSVLQGLGEALVRERLRARRGRSPSSTLRLSVVPLMPLGLAVTQTI